MVNNKYIGVNMKSPRAPPGAAT